MLSDAVSLSSAFKEYFPFQPRQRVFLADNRNSAGEMIHWTPDNVGTRGTRAIRQFRVLHGPITPQDLFLRRIRNRLRMLRDAPDPVP